MADHAVRIQFGEVCCAFVCRDAGLFRKLKASFDIFLSDRPADITIELELVDRRGDLEALRAVPSRVGGPPCRKLEMNGDIFGHVEFDAARRRVLAFAGRDLFQAAFEPKLLNKLLLQVYYTASRLKFPGRPPWMLVHSCGVLREGQALLFTGPCGTGKSTIGRLCGRDFGLPLNDEMMLISWPRAGERDVQAWAAPVFGELPLGSSAMAPLSAVFVLKQSRRTALRRLDGMEAYLRFLRQVMSPAGFDGHDTRATVSIMDSFAAAVTAAVPFFELEFTRRADLLWDVEAGLKDFMVRA